MRKLLIVFLALAVPAAVVGCRRSTTAGGRRLRPRIVSFSPALTDMLFEMGLGEHVVGVTAYCDLPAGQTRPVVGDLQSVNAEKILAVEPDVILVQQSAGDFDALRGAMPGLRIEHFTIETLDDIAAALERIGRLVGDGPLGRRHAQRFRRQLAAVEKSVSGRAPTRVFFLTGANPLTVAGRDSFIHGMIRLAGGDDLSGQYPRWTRINVERLLKDKPDVIVCQAPSHPDKAREYLMSLEGVPAVESGRVFIVTDRHWTIPSTRMARLTGELARMLHPELAGERAAP